MNLYAIRHGETDMGKNDSVLKYPEAESMKHVYQRVANFIDELKAKETDKNILFVTHGGIMRAIDWYFNGIDQSLFTCENCKIYSYTSK